MESAVRSSRNLDSEVEMKEYLKIEKKDKEEKKRIVTAMFQVNASTFTSVKKEKEKEQLRKKKTVTEIEMMF